MDRDYGVPLPTRGRRGGHRALPDGTARSGSAQGGATRIDLVATGDDETAGRSEALDVVGGDRGMVDGGLLQEVQGLR